MLDESTQQSVTGVLLVTFAIIEGGLILFIHHYCDLTTQRTSESGEVTQICTQDDDVALRRVASLSRKRVTARNLKITTSQPTGGGRAAGLGSLRS
jgi:hypothetical protein